MRLLLKEWLKQLVSYVFSTNLGLLRPIVTHRDGSVKTWPEQFFHKPEKFFWVILQIYFQNWIKKLQNLTRAWPIIWPKKNLKTQNLTNPSLVIHSSIIVKVFCSKSFHQELLGKQVTKSRKKLWKVCRVSGEN